MSGEDADENVELLRQAQEWEEVTAAGKPGAHEAFGQWLLASPKHVEAYLRVTSMHAELKYLDHSRDFDLKHLLAGTQQSK
jgi:ferric-dicitrate binding protein FerR (iron transport regulator)